MNKCFIESELGVVDFVEFDHKLSVEAGENRDTANKPLKNLEGALSFDDGGFAEGLLEVIDDLVVSLFHLLDILALGLVCTTAHNATYIRIIGWTI